jgi:hypothetical protein
MAVLVQFCASARPMVRLEHRIFDSQSGLRHHLGMREGGGGWDRPTTTTPGVGVGTAERVMQRFHLTSAAYAWTLSTDLANITCNEAYIWAQAPY